MAMPFYIRFIITSVLFSEPYLVSFPEALQLCFMMAKLLSAIFAGKTGVGILRKTLRMPADRKLPPKKKQERHTQQAPRIYVCNKYKRSKHHSKIPVVYAANGAASVLHKPRLKGAEEQYADHIAYTVRKADKYQYTFIQNPCNVKNTYRSVKQKPRKRNGKGSFP